MTCDDCGGSGKVLDAPSWGSGRAYVDTCPTCGGSGQVARLAEMLSNDPVVTEMCERIELQKRHDLARLDDRDALSYSELRSKGMTHGDAIVWLDRARPLR